MSLSISKKQGETLVLNATRQGYDITDTIITSTATKRNEVSVNFTITKTNPLLGEYEMVLDTSSMDLGAWTFDIRYVDAGRVSYSPSKGSVTLNITKSDTPA